MSRLAEIVVELQGQLVELDREVKQREVELAAARGRRNRIAGAVRALDPPPPKEKPKEKFPASAMVVSEKTLDGMTEWLRSHSDDLNESGFWAAKLVDDPFFTIFESDSGVRNALHALHQRGIIALDRKGQGGRRIYKVVS